MLCRRPIQLPSWRSSPTIRSLPSGRRGGGLLPPRLDEQGREHTAGFSAQPPPHDLGLLPRTTSPPTRPSATEKGDRGCCRFRLHSAVDERKALPRATAAHQREEKRSSETGVVRRLRFRCRLHR
nr:hypothetical protein Itr_chr07CG08860 [Ipomoea trifida]